MATYIHGSLARKEQTTIETPKVKEARRVVKRTKTLPMQEKLLYLFTVFVCVAVAGVIMWRYAQIYEMNTSIKTIQNEVRDLRAENDMLREKIEKANDPSILREEAKKYGLVPRDESNVVRIPERTADASAKKGGGSVAMKP